MVVSASVLEGLRHDDGAIVRLLLASVGGVPQFREHNVLDELVRRSLALVIDRDLLASADRYGSAAIWVAPRALSGRRDAPVGRRPFGMGRQSGQGASLVGEDGLFLAWPEAARDILELLEGDQLAGIPKAPDTLLDILLDAGVLTAPAEGSRNWAIFPTGAEKPIAAVRLASPAIVLAGNGTCPHR